MNAEKYKNTLPYPKKGDFTTTYWYRAGRVVATRDQHGMVMDPAVGETIELGACVKEEVVDNDAFRAAKTAYGQYTANLEAQFKQDLFVELGIVGHPKAEKLFAIAWEHGHASGYSEIMSYAWDLVDLIKD